MYLMLADRQTDSSAMSLLDLQVDLGVIRALPNLSTLFQVFVPPQVRTPFPVPIDRLFLYLRPGRCPARPLSHPRPTTESVISSSEFSLPQNLHRKCSISSCLLSSCSLASPWSRQSQFPLICQLQSALGSSTPPQNQVGFRHRPLFAQLI